MTTFQQKNKYIANSIYTFVLFSYVFLSYVKDAVALQDIFLQLFLYTFFAISFMRLFSSPFPITFTLWYTGFILISLVSVVYADSPEMTLKMIKNLLMAFLMGISIAVFLQIDDGLEKLKNMFLISGIIVGLYMAVTFKPERWWERLGESIGVNPNLIGLLYLIPLCFALCNLYYKNNRLMSCIAFIICGYNVMISGSKKALFGLVIFLITFLIFEKDVRNKFKYALIWLLVLYAIVLLILNVPMLYNIIGYRIDDMIYDLLNNKGVSSTSTTARLFMVQFGWNLFKEHPIFGYGLNNYAYYFGVDLGRATYAHNNYIEILVGLGLVGFFVYYSIHFYLARKLLSIRKTNLPMRAAFFISLLVLVIFYDFAMVSYYDTRTIILISIVLNYINKEENRKESEG